MQAHTVYFWLRVLDQVFRLFSTRIEVGLCRIVKPNLRENLFSDIG